MSIVWISIAALLVLGLVAALVSKLTTKGEEPPIIVGASCDTCDGTNNKCEQECMMEASVRPIEYFDDEELDTFAGRPSDSYSEAETEQVSDVGPLDTQPHTPRHPTARPVERRGAHAHQRQQVAKTPLTDRKPPSRRQ